MVKRRSRRFWSDEEKLSICQQANAPGVSVAQVARRYAMNANMIFKWQRDPRYASEEVSSRDGPAFLAVQIEHQVPDERSVHSEAVCQTRTTQAGRIEIVLAAGHRIAIEGEYDADNMARLLKGLAV